MEELEKEIKEILNLNNENSLYEELIASDDDNYKINNLDKLDTDFQKSNVLVTVNDDNLKYQNLDKISVFDYKIKVINTFKDNGLINLILKKYINDEMKAFLIASCFKRDAIKEEFINYMKDKNRYILCLINQFKDDNKIKEYYKKYANFEECLLCLKSKESILDFFKELRDEYYVTYTKLYDDFDENDITDLIQSLLLVYIKSDVTDETLKQELLGMLNKETLEKYRKYCNDVYQMTLKYNTEEIKNKDKNIFFKLYIPLKNNKNEFGDLLETWMLDIIREEYEEEIDEYNFNKINYFELTSKVYNYDERFLKDLQYICDHLNDFGYKLDEDEGITFCFDNNCLKTREEFNRFLNIYANCEYVINCMTNNSNKNNKNQITNIDDREYKKYLSVISVLNKKDLDDMEYFNIVKDLFDCKQYGLKFLETTIEYTPKNLKLDYQNIKTTFNLIYSMLYAAKHEEDNNEYYMNIINKGLYNDELKNNLLDLVLTSDDRIDYENRYEQNKIKKLDKINKPKKI